MSPNELQEWLKTAPLEEVINAQIWSAVMEGTAWCGWTDRARFELVKQVQESVKWALEQKLQQKAEDEK